ncbi:MAG: hypothetical protein KC550_03470 [Nanoarchaeota archaeon]|nr:hypothetical protein [Nanoarchaeota archaeon]
MKVRQDFGKYLAKLFIYNTSNGSLYYHQDGILSEDIRKIAISNNLIRFNGGIHYLGEFIGEEHQHKWNTPTVNIFMKNNPVAYKKGFYQAFELFMTGGRVPVLLDESDENGELDVYRLIKRPIIDLCIQNKNLEFLLRTLIANNLELWDNSKDKNRFVVNSSQVRPNSGAKTQITENEIRKEKEKNEIQKNPFLNSKEEEERISALTIDDFTTFDRQCVREVKDIWSKRSAQTRNNNVINRILKKG